MDLRKIESLAATVTTQHEQMEAAHAAEHAAELAVLERAIELAKPALRALCSRLVQTERSTWHGNNTYVDNTKTYHAERGVHLAGDSEASEDHPRDNDGSYRGVGLYLLADGRLAKREWSGHWSRWQGSGSLEESTLTPYASVSDCLKKWDLDDVLNGIADALKQQADGKKPTATKAAIERAERLKALATLSK